MFLQTVLSATEGKLYFFLFTSLFYLKQTNKQTNKQTFEVVY
jgi:hypothetical protein